MPLLAESDSRPDGTAAVYYPSVATAAKARGMSPRAFAIWTGIMTAIVAVAVGIFLVRVGPVGFALWFLPMFVALLVLSHSGRLECLPPAVLATALVGLWPLYRWLAANDSRTVKAYLVAAGIVNVLLLMMTAMEFARRRGWVVASPARRWINLAFLLANFGVSVSGWPPAPWRTVTIIALGVVLLLNLFWPLRRRTSLPNRPVTA